MKKLKAGLINFSEWKFYSDAMPTNLGEMLQAPSYIRMRSILNHSIETLTTIDLLGFFIDFKFTYTSSAPQPSTHTVEH